MMHPKSQNSNSRLNRNLATACLALACALFATGCSRSTSQPPAPGGSVADASSQTPASKPTNNGTPTPVKVGASVTLTANGTRKNPFTGAETPYQLNAEFKVDVVTLFRNATIAQQGSVIMLLVAAKNAANEPLSLQRSDFSLITESGKVYNAGLKPGGPWVKQARDHGPDMSDNLLVAFNVPYDGLKEPLYFAVGGMKLVRITDKDPSDTSRWLVCDEARLVKMTFAEFFR